MALREKPEIKAPPAVTRDDVLIEEFRQRSPEEFLKRRTELIRTVKSNLVEATYKPDGSIDRVNDYYCVKRDRDGNPISFAISRRGSGKLSDIYRIKPMGEETTEHIQEKDYVFYRCRVDVGRMGQVLGTREGSCSTAEKGFQGPGIHRKYGGWVVEEQGKLKIKRPADMRAADHDVLSKAQKRGYVQAIIDALSAHEILESAEEYKDEDVPVGDAEVLSAEPTETPDRRDTLVKVFRLAMAAVEAGAISSQKAVEFHDWANGDDRAVAEIEEQCVRLEEMIQVAKESTPAKGPIA